MIKVNRKLCAGALSLALLLAVAMPASAQSRFGGSMSTKKKVGIIAGGAAAGALLGGVINGKKGAVLGGVIGGGAGAGYVYIEGKREEDRYAEYDYYRYRDYRRDDYRRFNRRNYRR
ncbi:MAG TPA: hypothetical protein VKA70_16355 [Blastocatellia bacterium]|nr:hypothetical protein [Blastocatellia bacterium]